MAATHRPRGDFVSSEDELRLCPVCNVSKVKSSGYPSHVTDCIKRWNKTHPAKRNKYQCDHCKQIMWKGTFDDHMNNHCLMKPKPMNMKVFTDPIPYAIDNRVKLQCQDEQEELWGDDDDSGEQPVGNHFLNTILSTLDAPKLRVPPHYLGNSEKNAWKAGDLERVHRILKGVPHDDVVIPYDIDLSHHWTVRQIKAHHFRPHLSKGQVNPYDDPKTKNTKEVSDKNMQNKSEGLKKGKEHAETFRKAKKDQILSQIDNVKSKSEKILDADSDDSLIKKSGLKGKKKSKNPSKKPSIGLQNEEPHGDREHSKKDEGIDDEVGKSSQGQPIGLQNKRRNTRLKRKKQSEQEELTCIFAEFSVKTKSS